MAVYSYRDGSEELPHVAKLPFHEIVHEPHVLLFATEPASQKEWTLQQDKATRSIEDFTEHWFRKMLSGEWAARLRHEFFTLWNLPGFVKLWQWGWVFWRFCRWGILKEKEGHKADVCWHRRIWRHFHWLAFVAIDM